MKYWHFNILHKRNSSSLAETYNEVAKHFLAILNNRMERDIILLRSSEDTGLGDAHKEIKWIKTLGTHSIP